MFVISVGSIAGCVSENKGVFFVKIVDNWHFFLYKKGEGDKGKKLADKKDEKPRIAAALASAAREIRPRRQDPNARELAAIREALEYFATQASSATGSGLVRHLLMPRVLETLIGLRDRLKGARVEQETPISPADPPTSDGGDGSTAGE